MLAVRLSACSVLSGRRIQSVTMLATIVTTRLTIRSIKPLKQRRNSSERNANPAAEAAGTSASAATTPSGEPDLSLVSTITSATPAASAQLRYISLPLPLFELGYCVDLGALGSERAAGVCADYLERIFKSFVQAPENGHSCGRPGMGLQLSKHIVHMHEVTVSAASEGVGCGSQCMVRLPAARVEQSG